MAIVLMNPTNERFEGLYIGTVTVIEPGQKVKVDDQRGKFLLNELGPRGLIPLEYGDEGEVERRKAEGGRRRNLEFKKKQVVRYNQMNEARSNQKLPYVEPTKEIKLYAEELGIGLLEPYKFQDDQAERMATLREEVTAKDRLIAAKDRDLAAMQNQMTGMQDQLNQLMALIKGNGDGRAEAPAPAQEERDVELIELKKEIGYLPQKKDHYETWIANNWDKYETAPPEIQEDMRKKWSNFYNRPFPSEPPVLI
jgi:chromosome segregation ATPase